MSCVKGGHRLSTLAHPLLYICSVAGHREFCCGSTLAERQAITNLWSKSNVQECNFGVSRRAGRVLICRLKRERRASVVLRTASRRIPQPPSRGRLAVLGKSLRVRNALYRPRPSWGWLWIWPPRLSLISSFDRRRRLRWIPLRLRQRFQPLPWRKRLLALHRPIINLA